QATERALPIFGPQTRGAAVVMDVHTGDIVAMASVPTFNPNHFIQGFPPGEAQRLVDPSVRVQRNRATQEIYEPGSIFKAISGLACLEAGLNPNEIYRVAQNPHVPGRGIIYVGRQPFRDLASPGDYNFRRAFKISSNSYFITNSL